MAEETVQRRDIVDNRQRLAQWFAEHQAALFRYALRLMADEERAADIVQETFLRALAALSKQAPPANAPASVTAAPRGQHRRAAGGWAKSQTVAQLAGLGVALVDRWSGWGSDPRALLQ